MDSQVPFGSVVYIAGWIQGLTARAHQAIEWLRATARGIVREHEEHQTAMVEYTKKLETELQDALEKLRPSEEKCKDPKKVFGKSLAEIRDELLKGAHVATVALKGEKKRRKVTLVDVMDGEAPPHLEPSPPIPGYLKEALAAWENKERKAGRTPPIRVEMDKPLWLPPQLRDQYRITTRQWIHWMMTRKKKTYAWCLVKFHEEFDWLIQWAKKNHYPCW